MSDERRRTGRFSVNLLDGPSREVPAQGHRGDEGFHGAGGVRLHSGQDVLVALDGERVAGGRAFGHDVDGHTGGDEQGAVGVAQFG